MTATFADDTANIADADSANESALNLQHAIDKINAWTTRSHIKLNKTKLVHINFINKELFQIVPYCNMAKYQVRR